MYTNYHVPKQQQCYIIVQSSVTQLSPTLVFTELIFLFISAHTSSNDGSLWRAQESVVFLPNDENAADSHEEL